MRVKDMGELPTAGAQLTLLNRQGLHARAAAAFIKALQGLDAEVLVSWEGRTVNGRSILELLTLGAPQGSVLEIHIQGADAAVALAALTKLAENRFDEE